MDDYILADFVDGDQRLINFYVSYYVSQRKGESVHPPPFLLPWQ
ncbi:MAG: exosortase-associated EpsI family protein [Candidatus Brocadia sp.]|nr:exosortase-associated EpsI family protein [Candidatus Brocadia sp.]